ncbi:hypothetical protein [Eubacterium sp. 1001713B170207_170306_E7]|uniref:hypothetical protein n=1 Tax=Eubacterium sp. 1001713B170207_170306_E7 TaxID=2787097 RepID=UPI001897B5D2|nr:hypothetical protein [Eubacterium sp. 1001713B170207_170306_E7]
MIQNRYGKGPGVIPGRRLFNIQAGALVDMDIWARTPEEAEDAYNTFREAVTGHFAGLYLEDAVIFESEADRE